MRVRHLGSIDYAVAFAAMKDFTAARDDATDDEIWLCQHPSVFTQGLSGKAEHLLRDIGIPVVQIDRGGQITYHGPGQVLAYLLVDLRRKSYKVRELVRAIEQSVIDVLARYGVKGERRGGAPGVYVGDAKIAALGLRIKGGCSYHGVALNVNMDLAPYDAINPCGYPGLAVTQLSALCPDCDTDSVADQLATALRENLQESTMERLCA